MNELLGWLHQARVKHLRLAARGLPEAEAREWKWHWPLHARQSQLPPPGDWRVWLVMAGRGFGKTRTGAEWINSLAEADPEARIALVAANLNEARSVMVEGESGIMACVRPDRRPDFEPSLRRLTWPNGAQAWLYSAAEPESLRGPQHSHARSAGPEGDHCQRKPSGGGRPSAARGGRHRGQSACNAPAWPVLDRRKCGHRSFCRT
ncbi:terminase large subunit domain-containing protein [Novosphingobium cyanobacteriorum]|uniref:terminase large subunit domain-containing protein n=1 Tax=Novosphingobium cyanobacteriorum TaxID=3024215 RepID=UPI003F68B883